MDVMLLHVHIYMFTRVDVPLAYTHISQQLP